MKLRSRWFPVPRELQMNEALQSGEINIAGPIIQDFYMQDQFQVVLTDAIFDITPVVIYKGKEYSSCLSTIAVTETSLYSELMVSLSFQMQRLNNMAHRKNAGGSSKWKSRSNCYSIFED